MQQAVSSQSVNDLQQNLRQLRFDNTDAFLIAAAVAVTRNFDLPVYQHENSESLARSQLVDALVVTFMFNVVNRIANAYALEPEWVAWRGTQSLRRITRTLMSFGLPLQMPLAHDDAEDGEPLFPHMVPLLQDFGIRSFSPVWQQLHVQPSAERAIYQLLWVALNCSPAACMPLDDLTTDCVNLTGQGCRRHIPNKERSIWQQLYAKPYRLPHSALSELALGEAEKLDATFRVALLAAIHKLNGKKLYNLVLQACYGLIAATLLF